MKRLIMGVDGGGTKSHLALFDAAGKLAGAAVRGPLNHEVMEGSYTELETVLRHFISDALKDAGAELGDVEHTVLGIAGVDTAAQHELIFGILRRIGLAGFTLCNDAFLGVAAGCPGGKGIGANNGTGFSIAAMDHSGAAVQVGGLGDLTNDCGGGSWFGAQAVSAVYDVLYKCGPPTMMQGLLFAKLDISHQENYLDTVTAGIQRETLDINELNRLVFEAAGLGDAVALGILQQSAAQYAGGIVYLAKHLDFPGSDPLYVTFAGSLFVKEKIKILPRLVEERVCAALDGRSVEFRSLEAAPVAGAVLWAARKAGFAVEPAAVRAGLAGAGLK